MKEGEVTEVPWLDLIPVMWMVRSRISQSLRLFKEIGPITDEQFPGLLLSDAEIDRVFALGPIGVARADAFVAVETEIDVGRLDPFSKRLLRHKLHPGRVMKSDERRQVMDPVSVKPLSLGCLLIVVRLALEMGTNLCDSSLKKRESLR